MKNRLTSGKPRITNFTEAMDLDPIGPDAALKYLERVKSKRFEEAAFAGLYWFLAGNAFMLICLLILKHLEML